MDRNKVMIDTHCHCCGTPMLFEAVPVSIVEVTEDGVSTVVYWGNPEAIWICGFCREDPVKLRAARKATGWLPGEPNVSQYDA